MERYRQRVHAAGLEGDVIILDGMPFQRIVDMVQDKKVDLIVMGTHGWTGLKHVLLGSVAEKVVRLAPCPVLVARGVAPVSRQ
jgi:nucleotide-binding universal stress UspA family protein